MWCPYTGRDALSGLCWRSWAAELSHRFFDVVEIGHRRIPGGSGGGRHPWLSAQLEFLSHSGAGFWGSRSYGTRFEWKAWTRSDDRRLGGGGAWAGHQPVGADGSP